MSQSKPMKEEDEIVFNWIRNVQQDNMDEASKEKLILHYEGLVYSLARKYAYKKENFEDLAQVGMIGLLVAAERFDESFGKSFEAFAIPTIIGEIKRFIRDKTWSVHVPRRIKELNPKINRAVEELTNSLQKSPTIQEIANHLDVSEEEVLETMEMSKSYKALSVDHQHEMDGEGGAISILELVGEDEENYEKVDIHLLLESILPSLPEREQLILQGIFFENLNQQEVGEKLGISQMHVSRLQRRSLETLREILETELGHSYVFDK